MTSRLTARASQRPPDQRQQLTAPEMLAADIDTEDTLLIPRVDASPTQSRLLHALLDALCMLAAFLAFVLVRLSQLLSGLLRKHTALLRPRTLTIDAALTATLNDAVAATLAALRSRSLHTVSRDLPPSSTSLLTNIDQHATALDLQMHLKAYQGAYELCIERFDLVADSVASVRLQTALENLLVRLMAHPAADCQEAIGKARFAYKEALKASCKDAAAAGREVDPGAVLAEFKFQALMLRIRTAPTTLQKPLLPLAGGAELHERVTSIPLGLGLTFLEQCGGGARHPEQAGFMERHNGSRPSAAKTQVQVQAMAINARLHSIGVQRPGGEYQEVYGEVRSGAFATHGRKPKGVGLSELKRLLEQWRGAEVARREDWTVAQALPVVAACVRQLCGSRKALSSALRSGRFLYLQQSFLSDTAPNERGMLQDMWGALDALSQQLTIRFSKNPPSPLEVHPNRITLHLPLDLLPASPTSDTCPAPSPHDPDALPPTPSTPTTPTREDFEGRSFGLLAVLASQGVNARQSLGFLVAGDRTQLFQDVLNQEAVEKLLSHAQTLGMLQEPALQELQWHYTPGPGAHRAAKDMVGVRLIKAAALALGGGRTVVCKSGKDRTAMVCSLLLIVYSRRACDDGGVQERQGLHRHGAEQLPLGSSSGGRPGVRGAAARAAGGAAGGPVVLPDGYQQRPIQRLRLQRDGAGHAAAWLGAALAAVRQHRDLRGPRLGVRR